MKRSLLISVLLVTAALMCGCTLVDPPTHGIQDDVISSIRYAKDPRTGICFAIVGSNNGHFGSVVSIATVPCAALEPVR